MSGHVFILENIERVRRHKLGSTLGVVWYTTPLGWISIAFSFISSMIVAVLMHPEKALWKRLRSGMAHANALIFMEFIHTLGHIVSGKAAGAPMEANVITSTTHLNLYHRPPEQVSRTVHIIRSLGGPLANMVAGLAGWVRWRQTENKLWLFVALSNFVLGVGSLLPLPGIDGDTIWRGRARSQAISPASDAAPTSTEQIAAVRES